MAVVIAVSVNYSVSGSESGFFLYDEFGSLFFWAEELSDEDLDYFVVLDAAAAEFSLRLEVGEVSDFFSAGSERRRRKVVSKRSVGEMSRRGRYRRMGVERVRFRVYRFDKRDLLFSSIGTSIGEGDLRNFFEGEELKIMLFNYREAGIIPKVETM